MELGGQIKRYRIRLGLSQEELADRIFVTRQSVSNWENGRTYLLTEEEFAGLADVLTAAGEDFRQESGEEGCRLLAEEAEE